MSWMNPCSWTWPRESISDSEGIADVAYVGLFMVAGAVVFAIFFMCLLSGWAYYRCHAFTLDSGVTVNCTFDPQPLGIAIGAACGGLATALGALAGYMVATRRQPRTAAPAAPAATSTVTTTATTTQPIPAEASTDVEPTKRPKIGRR